MNILAIDPGSTSTKVGVWRAGKLVKASIEHPRGEIESFHSVMEQLDYRMERLARYLRENDVDRLPWDAVVGRGGLVRPVPSGVYLVEEPLIKDLKDGVSGEHAANLGGVMAHAVAASKGVPAYVVDPPVIDEMWPVARLSGMAGIERRSMFHALNQKAVARDVARELGRDYAELNLIVVHMGGGITAGAHRKGLVVDVNNGLNGDGPFSPERTGGLPVVGVLELVERGAFTTGELKGIVARRGGVYSYLNTVDMREVEARAQGGDAEASLVQEAMIYQIAKEIGGLAAALSGAVDGIVLTGGLAFGAAVVEGVRERVGFIAPVFVRPGEFEIEALVDGALRVLSGTEAARRYAGGTDEDRG
ncbi:butyrate kinase [Geomonas oryzae]|uniref:butyrate kinase n=1 Tax=Geomonas oryzae TaxID=2364273 RepID=UPI00100A713A|nr:butyrate kinase [Geomonas oryzae]